MSTFMSENLIKIITLIVSTLGILATLVQFQSFSIQMHGKQVDREYIIFSQYMTGAPFLTYDEPDYRKGVLDAIKLDALTNDSFEKSFSFADLSKYLVVIITDSKGWVFGDDSILKEKNRLWEHPVAVNTSAAVIPGTMKIYVPRIG
ncbi:MAG: hypothetical protein HY515_03770 [Candidatus Aenigmarchaeota archaeon]|nr:hypothetical protein [Candidatus Aenigmarchaeota archaeon]